MDILTTATIFLLGFIIAWLLKTQLVRRRLSTEMQTPQTMPLTPFNKRRIGVKEERKKLIVDYVDMNGQVTCREVEEVFGVSSATATRYLQELLREGRIKQHGKGRSTHYTI